MQIDERKKLRGIKRLKSSLKFAFDGLKYAYKNEQSMTVHIIITILVIMLGVIFKINSLEWIAVVFCIGIMMCLELVNTSIEAVVDLVTEKYNEKAKVAKDVAAAVSVMFSFTSIIIGLIVFIPKVIEFIRSIIWKKN